MYGSKIIQKASPSHRKARKAMALELAIMSIQNTIQSLILPFSKSETMSIEYSKEKSPEVALW